VGVESFFSMRVWSTLFFFWNFSQALNMPEIVKSAFVMISVAFNAGIPEDKMATVQKFESLRIYSSQNFERIYSQ
jgi:hypothetical protein